jgi:hypothetical protein
MAPVFELDEELSVVSAPLAELVEVPLVLLVPSAETGCTMKNKCVE